MRHLRPQHCGGGAATVQVPSHAPKYCSQQILPSVCLSSHLVCFLAEMFAALREATPQW